MRHVVVITWARPRTCVGQFRLSASRAGPVVPHRLIRLGGMLAAFSQLSTTTTCTRVSAPYCCSGNRKGSIYSVEIVNL